MPAIAGAGRSAAAETGRTLRQLQVDTLADYIAAVKADRGSPTLCREFFDREKALRSAAATERGARRNE